MPTVSFPQIAGPSYVSISGKPETQRAINVIRQRVETGEGVAPFFQTVSPGLQCWLRLNAQTSPIRGLYELDEQIYAANGERMYQIKDGPISGQDFGPIVDDGQPVIYAAQSNQVLFLSGKKLYRIHGISPVQAIFEVISTPFTPIAIAYLDTYYVALADDHHFLYFSKDGVTWPADQVQSAVEADANANLALITHDQALFVYGNRVTQVYLIGGNPNAPLVPQTNAVVNCGIKAPHSLKALGHYRYWLGRNRDGENMVFRGLGYSFERVSNHYVEDIIRSIDSFVGTEDAIGMAYQQEGQEFYRLAFPAANYTLEFNATTGDWLEPLHWNWRTGSYERHRANCIVSAFGKVLVGDHSNGWIYQMSPDFHYDAGFPLRWERWTPHLAENGKRIQSSRLNLFMETGVGLEPPLWLHTYDRTE